MDLRHETPLPDTLFRIAAPLIVGFPDGASLRVTQWNLRALYDARLAERDLTGAMLSVPFQGVGVYFEVTLTPGDTPDEFLFEGLTGRQRETLGLFYRNLLSGRMAVTSDIITSLDTPVDLVPMEETEAEARVATSNRTPRPMRAMASLAVYVLIFVLVFSYLGALVIDRLSTIHVTAGHAAPASADPLSGQAIVARLDPAHVTDVWVGMSATITYNEDGQRQRLPAQVRRLDHTGPASNPAILLTVVPVSPTDRARLSPGMPVKVDLDRQLLRRALGLTVGGSAT
ncbi:MAG: hypothetical protein JJT81_07090 [Rubellimicrobium sp.]|nr:hypothetical protein [Rubellimicrobium sp.]